MAIQGPFQRGGTKSTTQSPSPEVTVTTTEQAGNYGLSGNGASWVLVWGLALVGLALVTGSSGEFYAAFVHPGAKTSPGIAAEIVLGLLFVGVLTFASSLSSDAAIMSLVFEFAITLVLVYHTMDWWSGALSGLVSSATSAKK